MANSYSTRIVFDGDLLATVVVHGIIDSSDQNKIVAIDSSLLSGTPGNLVIRRVQYDIGGAVSVVLHRANSRIGSLSGSGTVEGKYFGGINTPSSNTNGNIYLETSGWTSGTVSYTLTIEVKKQIASGVFSEAVFVAPLQKSIIQTKGAGPVSYSRASTAVVRDWEGKWITVPSGAARFGGARMVYNVQPKSEPASGWVGVGTSAPTIAYTTLDGTGAVAVTFPSGGSGFAFSRASSSTLGWFGQITSASKAAVRVVLKLSRALTGGEAITLLPTGDIGFSDFLVLNASTCPTVATLFGGICTSPGTGTNISLYAYVSGALSSPVTLTLTRIQITDITGAAVQAPPEYVSRGVLAAPYHGGGIDGVKWFDFANGNSLLGSTITEAAGTPITKDTTNPLMLLFEGLSTNYLTYSDDCTNAAWVKTNCTAAFTATDPAGLANNASTLTATAANGTCLQTLTRSSTTRISGVLIKRRTGSGTINMTQDNGATWTALSVTSNWQWLAIPKQTIANPIIGFRIVTSGDAVDVWAIQHEERAELSSPIRTTTAATTRAACSLSWPRDGNCSKTTGAMYAECYRPYSDSALGGLSAVMVAIEDGSGRMYIDTNTTRLVSYDGTNLVAKNGLTDYVTGIRKRACSYSGATILLAGDGTSPQSGSFDGAMGAGTTSSLWVGTSNNGNPLFGYIGNVHVWMRALSSAELQQITT